MKANFDTCCTLGFQSEGGYVNNPADPGGATNKGITLATARRDISPSFTIAQLKALTTEQAEEVYRREYWSKMDCDDLPAGIDYAVYDYGINSGPARPINVLRALLGQPVGKSFDVATLHLLDGFDEGSVIDAICDERLEYMRGLEGGKLWKTFGKGWTARVLSVRTRAKRMAAVASVKNAPPLATDVVAAIVPHDPVAKAIPAPVKPATHAAATVTTAAVPAAVGTALAVHAHHGFPVWAIVLPICALCVGGAVYGVMNVNREAAATLPATLATKRNLKPKAA